MANGKAAAKKQIQAYIRDLSKALFDQDVEAMTALLQDNRLKTSFSDYGLFQGKFDSTHIAELIKKTDPETAADLLAPIIEKVAELDGTKQAESLSKIIQQEQEKHSAAQIKSYLTTLPKIEDDRGKKHQITKAA